VSNYMLPGEIVELVACADDKIRVSYRVVVSTEPITGNPAIPFPRAVPLQEPGPNPVEGRRRVERISPVPVEPERRRGLSLVVGDESGSLEHAVKKDKFPVAEGSSVPSGAGSVRRNSKS
jgi:hypothetical protein